MKKYVLCFISMLMGVCAYAQDGVAALAEEGFENVSVSCENTTVYSVIEDPAYRGTFRGPAKAIMQLSKTYPRCERIELVILEYETPKVALHAAKVSGRWTVQVDYDTHSVTDRFTTDSAVSSANKSTGKVDVTLNPIVSLDNHRFDKLFEAGFFLAPTVEATLWKGNRINIEPIVPVYTNMDVGSRDRRLQLGSTNIQQDFIFGGRWYGTLSVGTFRSYRLGANVDLGYRVLPQMSVGIRANWTVDSYFGDDNWYVGSVDFKGNRSEVSALLRADYFDVATALNAQLTAGRFLYGDYGARLDITRHYGDYAIGVFGILTGGEHNAGFHFAIPVRGKRNKQGGYLRVNLPEYYDMQYNMVSYFEYAAERMGTELEVRPIENRSLQYWNAAYIQRNVQRILDGKLD